MIHYVIVVAGGKGLRMGAEVPKQFLLLKGKPVLMHTLDVFRKSCPDAQLILVLPQAHRAMWEKLCEQYQYTAPIILADGGETRFHSVHHGLSCIPSQADGLVAVHDGVRPLVSAQTIARCAEQALVCGAVVPVVPVVDSIRQTLPEGESQAVDRAQYYLVQTPQVFDIQLLKHAYEQPFSPSFTDDASVVEAMGHKVALVEGNRENIKLTSPMDLAVATCLLKEE